MAYAVPLTQRKGTSLLQLPAFQGAGHGWPSSSVSKHNKKSEGKKTFTSLSRVSPPPCNQVCKASPAFRIRLRECGDGGGLLGSCPSPEPPPVQWQSLTHTWPRPPAFSPPLPTRAQRRSESQHGPWPAPWGRGCCWHWPSTSVAVRARAASISPTVPTVLPGWHPQCCRRPWPDCTVLRKPAERLIPHSIWPGH